MAEAQPAPSRRLDLAQRMQRTALSGGSFVMLAYPPRDTPWIPVAGNLLDNPDAVSLSL